MFDWLRKKAVDPVCGMQVDPSKATTVSEYNGETYFFCAASCKEAFEKDPKNYLTQKIKEV